MHGVDVSSGTVRVEAPPDAALDAPRSFFFSGNLSWYATWRDEGHNRDLKRVLRNCHQRFFEERALTDPSTAD